MINMMMTNTRRVNAIPAISQYNIMMALMNNKSGCIILCVLIVHYPIDDFKLVVINPILASIDYY